MGDKTVYVSLKTANERKDAAWMRGFLIGFALGVLLLFLTLGAMGQLVFIEAAVAEAIELHG